MRKVGRSSPPWSPKSDHNARSTPLVGSYISSAVNRLVDAQSAHKIPDEALFFSQSHKVQNAMC
jgi:hypothetical protein